MRSDEFTAGAKNSVLSPSDAAISSITSTTSLPVSFAASRSVMPSNFLFSGF